jgi:hypothetical protein
VAVSCNNFVRDLYEELSLLPAMPSEDPAFGIPDDVKDVDIPYSDLTGI